MPQPWLGFVRQQSALETGVLAAAMASSNAVTLFAGVILGALIYGEALSRGGGRPPRPSRHQETVSPPRRRAITSRS